MCCSVESDTGTDTFAQISYRVVSGHAEITYKDLSERGKLLVDSFFIAVSDIQLTYGDDYVKIGAERA